MSRTSFIDLENSNDAVEINRQQMIQTPEHFLHDESWIEFAKLVAIGKTSADGPVNPHYHVMSFSGREAFREWMVDQLNTRFGILGGATNQFIIVRTMTPELRFKIVTMSTFSAKALLASAQIYDFTQKDIAHWQFETKKNNGEFTGNLRFKSGRKEDADDAPFKPEVTNRPILEVWLEHPKACRYTRTTFKPFPSNCKPKHAQAIRHDECNTWTGFAISKNLVDNRKPLFDWSAILPMLNHIRYVLCDTDEQALWFIGFCAHMLQRPYEKPGVAIFLGGEPGVGKGMIWQTLIKIIGDAHSIQVYTMADAVGERFTVCNDMIFRFYDEVLFNTQAQMDILKTQVSETKERQEKKFQDTEYKTSYCRIGGCTNSVNNFMKPGEKDRRFLLLHADIDTYLSHPAMQKIWGENIKEAKRKYFEIWHDIMYSEHKVQTGVDEDGKKVFEKIENYGLKVWANFLYQWDLTGWNPKQIPDSLLMWKQRRANLDPVPSWWMDCLLKGYIYNVQTTTKPSTNPKGPNHRPRKPSSDLIDQPLIADVAKAQSYQQNQWENGDLSFLLDVAYENFRKSEDARKEGAPKNSSEWLFSLKTYIPSSSVQGEKWEPLSCTNMKSLTVPDLETCRESFCEKIEGMQYFFAQNPEEIDSKFDRKARISTLFKDKTYYTSNYPVSAPTCTAQALWSVGKMPHGPRGAITRALKENPEFGSVQSKLSAMEKKEIKRKMRGEPTPPPKKPAPARAPTAQDPTPAKRVLYPGDTCELCCADLDRQGCCTASNCPTNNAAQGEYLFSF